MVGTPTIIAAFHDFEGAPDFSESVKRAEKILHGIAKSRIKRRLFIEGTQKGFDEYISAGRPLEGETLDPIGRVVLFARAAGWEIVPLDKESHEMLVDKNVPLYKGEKGRLTASYVDFQIRHRYWAAKLKRLKVSGADFILIWPDHVKGFVSNFRRVFGLTPKVVWIDRPPKNLPLLLHRLSNAELAKLKRMRAKSKQERLAKRKSL